MKTETDRKGELICVKGDFVEFIWNQQQKQWDVSGEAGIIGLVTERSILSIDKTKVSAKEEWEIYTIEKFISAIEGTSKASVAL